MKDVFDIASMFMILVIIPAILLYLWKLIQKDNEEYDKIAEQIKQKEINNVD